MNNLRRHGYIAGPGTVVLSCSAYLVSYSATARYVIREYGQENMFRLKPAVGMAVRLVNSPTTPWSNKMFLLHTRASNRHPLLHSCLTNLTHLLHQSHTSWIHLPIYDPERSINLLPAWYATLRNHFTDQNLEIVLHDRVYVSIASITSTIIGTK